MFLILFLRVNECNPPPPLAALPFQPSLCEIRIHSFAGLFKSSKTMSGTLMCAGSEPIHYRTTCVGD